MTKKDYELIADSISQSMRIERDMQADNSPTASKEAEAAIQTLAVNLAGKLALDNARFDKSRFLAACGIKY